MRPRHRAPRRGVMLILSTLVVTFVGMTGVLGLWALSNNAAVLVKMTGLATSAAYAGASAVDLNATSAAQEWVVLNEAEARDLARQAFAAGASSMPNITVDPLRDDQILVYNIAATEPSAKSADPNCATGINGTAIAAPASTQQCWLAASYLAALPSLPGIIPQQSRGCRIGTSNLTCSMHFTSGVSVTVGYTVSRPCGGAATGIPFCRPFKAIAVGYADYTAKDG